MISVPDKVRCFWLEPTDRVQISLRRYRGLRDGESCCSRFGYHNAEVVVGEAAPKKNEDGYLISLGDTIPHDDPRWPKACPCGYEFSGDDVWLVNQATIYTRLDTKEELTLDDAGPGAMWDAKWYRNHFGTRDPRPNDGITLMVRCPSNKSEMGADWFVDGPASNGPGWTRAGAPNSAAPTVTATPSIGIGEGNAEYHGWLRDGYLVKA